ncbi:3-deoxy-7-phosphoheptulonate synthase [Streptomyces sp. NPDC060131]|uniref:3-deoxy-7-phosphoheptulonate synthase n=1 Tax=unclassified Streptomyces TaxID=2593676 RepID=UPI0036678407
MSLAGRDLIGSVRAHPASEAVIRAVRARRAWQQPDWPDPAAVAGVTAQLASAPGLVSGSEAAELRGLLAEVAGGRLLVLQAGDCAEVPEQATPERIAHRAGLLHALGDALGARARRPVVTVGRIGGQYAKPRSQATEVRDGRELPAFRGHLVNGPDFDAESRTPDPRRMTAGYRAAAEVAGALASARPARSGHALPRVWTSHEALVLDYELPLVRRHDGRPVLTSTHWPWIGDRTRQLDGAHVELLSQVSNAVACKVGPGMTAAELVAVCDRLDPGREPGRLSLIARLGERRVEALLPPLVAAVRRAGHPVVWLCDPMHGNTFRSPQGRKIRLVGSLVREVRAFHAAVTAERGVAGGLHLEVSPAPVVECVSDEAGWAWPPGAPEPLCDPRLNPAQAHQVVAAWPGR